MLALALLAALACAAATPPAAAPVPVTFALKDAMVKDKPLPGVTVLVGKEGEEERVVGVAGADGQLQLPLAPGRYTATFRLHPYVAVEHSPFSVEATGGTVTVALTPMLEAAGDSPRRRVQVVLNWGSRQADQVRDVDSHLTCPCLQSAEVAYGNKVHEADGHSAALDVDDTSWGGPETITLLDPPPGRYVWWAWNYSDGPGTLGGSDLVVRVVIGDRQGGEFRAPADLAGRKWLPFRAIEVDDRLEPRVVAFTEAEIAAGEDRSPPPALSSPPSPASASAASNASGLIAAVVIVLGAGVGLPGLALFLALRAARKRQQ